MAKCEKPPQMPLPALYFSRWMGALFAIATLCSLVGCQRGEASGPNTMKPVVTVAQPVSKQIVEWDAYTGRLEAVEFVEIRSRVSGYLQSIHFDEGQIIKDGDLLFVIDPRPYEAALNGAKAKLTQATSQLEQANAQLAVAKANQLQSNAKLQLAKAQVERARSLQAGNAVSQEELDQREAEFLQAKADGEATKAGVKSAEAAIATAKAAITAAEADVEAADLNLDYTKIRAPVNGRISRQFVSDGNLVSGGTATSTLLTTIASVEPIYCTFDANEQEVLKYVRLANQGKRVSSRDAKNPVFLGLVDEDGFPHQGHMDFVDNRFDADTASMRARCIFPNEDQVLLPGMFARIRIPGSAPYRAVLIPDSAVASDQASQFVYVVVEGVAEHRPVKLGPIVDGLRVVREGLSGEETIVIEGLLQARPGAEVETKPGTIEVNEDGLPDDYVPVPREKWLSPEPAPVPDKLLSPSAEGETEASGEAATTISRETTP